MTRGLDSANAFASLELERSRTPSFHELDALGTESEVSTSLQVGSGSILSWLREQCEIFRENNQNSDAFAGWTDICGNICRVCLNTSSSDDQVASELFDLLGDGGFDLVASVCERRGQLADAIRRRLQALKEAFDPEESAQDDYAKSKSAVSVRSTTDVAMEKIRKKEERRNKRRAAGGHGEYLLEWFTNDSGLGYGAFCDDSLPLPNRNEAAPGSVDDILNSLRGLGLGTDGGKKLCRRERLVKSWKVTKKFTYLRVSLTPWQTVNYKFLCLISRLGLKLRSKVFRHSIVFSPKFLSARIRRTRTFLYAHLLVQERRILLCYARCKK